VAVVSAFHNVSADALQDGRRRSIATCSFAATTRTRRARLGADCLSRTAPLDAGPLEMSRVVESITALLV
jgi:predicted dinucleotide-binding enzyme